MTVHKNDPADRFEGEQTLFAVRAGAKRRIVTALIFVFFTLVTLAGIFLLKSVYISVMGFGAMILAFWPFADAFDRIEVTDKRIKYSAFSKMTAKAEDIPLDELASCTEIMDGSVIELLFVVDGSLTLQSIRRLQFSTADENAILLTQLPCPKYEELRQILALNHR